MTIFIPPHLEHPIGKHKSKEYHRPCPKCGGTDRFYMRWKYNKHNVYCLFGDCRHCDHEECWWEGKGESRNQLLTRVEIAERDAKNAKRYAEHLEKKNRELERIIAQFRQSRAWVQYNAEMDEKAREMWRQAGFSDTWQDFFMFGFDPSYRYKLNNGTYYETCALTIPYFDSDGQALTLQRRLCNPHDKDDKYRFTYGLGSPLWRAEPEREIKNRVLVTEGAKKGGVAFVELVGNNGIGDLTIVALPNKSPSEDNLDLLRNADPLILCLDPDAYVPTTTQNGKRIAPAVNKIKKLMGKTPTKIMKLPCKADDFFTEYGGEARDFVRAMGMAV